MDENDFAIRLAKLRMLKGISARDMSLSLGQNAGYIYDIESGKSLPSLSVFFCICDYLGMAPSEFFDEGNSNPIQLREAIDLLRKLNDRQLKNVIALMKDIVG